MMEVIQFLTSCAGVLGFVFSSAHIFWQVRNTSQRLKIVNFRADYIIGEINDECEWLDIGMGFAVSFTAVNHSSRIIPITGVSLESLKHSNLWLCKQDTAISSKGIRGRERIPVLQNTTLPVNIAPHSSLPVSLIFSTRVFNHSGYYFELNSPYTVDALKQIWHITKFIRHYRLYEQKWKRNALVINTGCNALTYLFPENCGSTLPISE